MTANWLPKVQTIAFAVTLLAGALGLAAKGNMVLEAQGPFIDFGYFWTHFGEAKSQSLIYWVCNLTFFIGFIISTLLEYLKRTQR